MDEILQADTTKRAMNELFIAGVATIITLLFSLGLFLWVVPRITGDIGKEENDYRVRTFESSEDGGRIQYSLNAEAAGEVDQKQELEGFGKDLEVLARRFRRGDFQLTTLPGSNRIDINKDLVANADKYTYQVAIEGNAAVLTVKSSGKKATQTFHAYLDYLKANWQ